MVSNNAAKTAEGMHSRMALWQAGFTIVTLFSPEHGLATTGEDGSFQHNTSDPLTQLPVISLYGDRLLPTAEELAGIDAVLFDIPDVGCRFYTYLWTMTYVMEACAKSGKRLIILDRPNPISGNIQKAEGPMLEEKTCSSFIGRWSIPVRHCCTLGELATYFSATRKIDIDLEVVRVKNWNRNQLTAASSFTPTSPAIATLATALCYPGMGLLEGITVNEGRGTPHPFTCFGAPWISNSFLLEKIEQQNLPGIKFSEIQYTPSGSLFSGEHCFGLSLTVTDDHAFMPVRTGITIIQQLLELYPGQCQERLYKTIANPSGEKHLDKLLGIENSILELKDGKQVTTDLTNEWEERITPFLLYH